MTFSYQLEDFLLFYKSYFHEERDAAGKLTSWLSLWIDGFLSLLQISLIYGLIKYRKADPS